MDFSDLIDKECTAGRLPLTLASSLRDFYVSYRTAVTSNHHHIDECQPLLATFLELVIKQLQEPQQFEPYHRQLRAPIDCYRFGLELMRPLVDFSHSRLCGDGNLKRINEQLARGENVILLANHQTEPDPQAISLLLEKQYPQLAESMIFIAGHRVISDPLAVPFSMGCNLLCIFSKKYIETPPEEKSAKLEHNRKTMLKMRELLTEGGKCIYMAPSGGRDRPNNAGVIEVAPFDPQSIELFWLMAQQAGTPTHFYPLALATYNLLPPPQNIGKELGEQRYAQRTPIHIAFGEEVDMRTFPGHILNDKQQNRQRRAEYIWQQVNILYTALVTS
jgi:glycerol-3-phosphate O-acyltransferase